MALESRLGGAGFSALPQLTSLQHSSVNAGFDRLQRAMQFFSNMVTTMNENRKNRQAQRKQQKRAEKSAMKRLLTGAGIDLGTDLVSAGVGAAALGGLAEAPASAADTALSSTVDSTLPAALPATSPGLDDIGASSLMPGEYDAVSKLASPGLPAIVPQGAASAVSSAPALSYKPNFARDFGLLFAGTRIPGLASAAANAPYKTALTNADIALRGAQEARNWAGLGTELARANELGSRVSERESLLPYRQDELRARASQYNAGAKENLNQADLAAARTMTENSLRDPRIANVESGTMRNRAAAGASDASAALRGSLTDINRAKLPFVETQEGLKSDKLRAEISGIDARTNRTYNDSSFQFPMTDETLNMPLPGAGGRTVGEVLPAIGAGIPASAFRPPASGSGGGSGVRPMSTADVGFFADSDTVGSVPPEVANQFAKSRGVTPVAGIDGFTQRLANLIGEGRPEAEADALYDFFVSNSLFQSEDEAQFARQILEQQRQRFRSR